MGLKATAKDRDGLAGGRGARTPRHCGLGLDQDVAQIRSNARTGKSRSQSLAMHCDLAKTSFRRRPVPLNLVQQAVVMPRSKAGAHEGKHHGIHNCSCRCICNCHGTRYPGLQFAYSFLLHLIILWPNMHTYMNQYHLDRVSIHHFVYTSLFTL